MGPSRHKWPPKQYSIYKSTLFHGIHPKKRHFRGWESTRRQIPHRPSSHPSLGSQTAPTEPLPGSSPSPWLQILGKGTKRWKSRRCIPKESSQLLLSLSWLDGKRLQDLSRGTGRWGGALNPLCLENIDQGIIGMGNYSRALGRRQTNSLPPLLQTGFSRWRRHRRSQNVQKGFGGATFPPPQPCSHSLSWELWGFLAFPQPPQS